MNAAQEIARGREVLEEFQHNLRRSKRRPLILLVEDEANDANLSAFRLKQYQLDAMIAKTSEEAIALMDMTPFDVVFLDLKLPGGSGLDVLAYASNTHKEALFIVLTGIDDADPMIQEALNRGATSVVRKPLTNEHIKMIFGTP